MIILYFLVISAFSVDQIHLAYGGLRSSHNNYPTGMSVSFHSVHSSEISSVSYGLASGIYNWTVYARKEQYWEHSYHYHALILDLNSSTRYFYTVTDGFEVSKEYSFISSTPDLEVNITIVGDMGIHNSESTITNLERIVASGSNDFLIHLGDIGYADDAFLHAPFSFHYEDVWNQFMNSIQNIAATTPYMTLPGNHEAECHSISCDFSITKLRELHNFLPYRTRFNMPWNESGGADDMWYSLNIGPVHFVFMDTETDYPNNPVDHYSFNPGKNGGFGDQMKWLEQDLAKAHAERLSGRRPWIIVAGHRPVYSVTLESNGVPIKDAKSLHTAIEHLLRKYKVDVYLCGHVHGYERTYPTDGTSIELPLISENGNNVFSNPSYPMYIVNGAAGNNEGFSASPKIPPKWNAFVEFKSWGYGSISVSMKQLTWKFFTDTNKLVDTVTILKTTHVG